MAPSELELSPSRAPPPSKVESSSESAAGSDRTSVKSTWLPDAEFVDCHDISVSCDRVDKADVIGVSATMLTHSNLSHMMYMCNTISKLTLQFMSAQSPFSHM